MSPVLFRRAWSLADYLSLRRIRNSGREYLTHYSGEISALQQVRFWRRRRQHEIYLLSCDGSDVGYVLMSRGTEGALVTIVLLPGYRDRGFGKIAINHFKQFYDPMVAEIFASNTSSVRLFESCGFRHVRAEGNRVYLQYPR